MTIKQIAETCGVDERTVRRWIKKASDKMPSLLDKLSDSERSKVASEYDLDETIATIEKGMGKNAANLFRMSARQPTENLYHQPLQNGEALDAAFKIMAVAFDRLTRITESQETRLSKIETKIEQRQALLPAPQVKPRDNVSRIVRKYAHDNGMEHGTAWGELYREFGYRTNSNPRTAANNRKMAVIDYIETEGMMGLLESIAIDWGKS